MSTRSTADQFETFFAEVSGLAARLRGGWPLAGSGDGFSGGVAGVLQALGVKGPRTVPEIARQRQTSRQNVQVVVNRLRKAGLVELEGNPAHKRSALVRLTGRGEAALSQVAQTESRRLESLLAQLSGEDVVAASRVLGQVRQLLAGPTGAAVGQEQANRLPSRSEKQERPDSRPPRPSKPPVVEDSPSADEEFPLSLL